MEFSRTKYWNRQPFPSPVALPNPRMEPWSPTLRVDSLLAEPKRKPKNTGVGSLTLLQQIFPTQESYRGPLHCTRILYQLSYQGSPEIEFWEMGLSQWLTEANNNWWRILSQHHSSLTWQSDDIFISYTLDLGDNQSPSHLRVKESA